MKRFLLACSAVFSLSLAARAQSADSSGLLLQPAMLPDSLIARFPPKPPEAVFVSATRYAEKREQLPFTTHVITSEEILRNGYVTLADALKYAPGIRVSQPGNALEGETFFMRGLLGNEYVKVLINDVPVKPSLALGMPIGAQLPIRQAERIEILYGAAGAAYGSEACAGVVNIILKESERPVFTQANLSFGKGYNNLDLMFGGKVGRGKNIFRFSMYGSSTVRDETDVFSDENAQALLLPKRYLPFGLDSTALANDLSNFIPDPDNPDLPKIASFMHESRLFGLQMRWRGIQFGYQRMTRVDHSALGMNPLAVIYANASTRLNELVETYSMSFKTRIGKLRMNNTLSGQRYRMGDASSTMYGFEQLGAAYYFHLAPAPGQKAQAIRAIRDTLATGERFLVAKTLDLRFDTRFRLVLTEKLALDMGTFFQVSDGYAGTRYLERPVDLPPLFDSDTARFIRARPFVPAERVVFDANIFPNLKWQGRWLTVFVGSGLSTNALLETTTAPRAGFHVRVDSAWSLRLSGVMGFRRTPLWMDGNSFQLADGRARVADFDNPYLNAIEKTRSAELGARFSGERLSLDGAFFYQKAFNLARNGYLLGTAGGPVYAGWANAPGQALELWGSQLSAVYDMKGGEINLNNWPRTVVDWRNELNVQYVRGREWFGYGIAATDDVRQLPRWMWQFRSTVRANKLELIFASVRQFSWLSSGVFYQNAFQREAQERVDGSLSWDFMARYQMSQHFRVYLQALNLFNKSYAGLDATGTPDDLLWNPQLPRQVRFGIVYNME